MKISDILRYKGSTVAKIGPSASIADLLATLSEFNIGAAVVTEGDQVVGIVSERDIVRQLHRIGADLLQGTVAEIMTKDVVTCTPEDTIDSLAATMTSRRIRHMPVREDGRLVGIVSIGDVVKSRISQLETHRDQLESYIVRG